MLKIKIEDFMAGYILDLFSKKIIKELILYKILNTSDNYMTIIYSIQVIIFKLLMSKDKEIILWIFEYLYNKFLIF